MIKKSLIVANLLFVTTSAMAQNYFIGLDYSNMKASSNISTINNASGQIVFNKNYSDNSDVLNIKFGIDKPTSHRTYIKFGSLYDVTKDGISSKYEAISFNYDVYLKKIKYFKPYIGGGLGYGTFSWTGVGAGVHKEGNEIDMNFRVGSIIDVDEKIDIEIGYSLTLAGATAEYTDQYSTVKNKAETIKGLFFGLNYKF